MTLEQQLRTNVYGTLFTSIIDYFNNVTARPVNPWEALVIGAALRERVTNWNNGPVPPYAAAGYTKCDCGWGYVIVQCTPAPGVDCCTGNVCDEEVTSVAKTAGTQHFTLKELITQHAQDAGAANPYTTTVEKFLYEINNLVMDQANNYVAIQQGIDLYYEHVDFINYLFTTDQGDFYMELLGGEIREGENVTGIFAGDIADGDAPIPATAGNTDIIIGATTPLVDGTYFVVYTSLTTATAVWMDAGVGTLPPVVVIPGIVVSVVGALINPADPPELIAVSIATALLGVPGFASVTPLANVVTLITTFTGSRVASDFSFLFGTWSGIFVDGTDAEAGHPEISQIVYEYANYNDMPGRWFKMNEALDHLFYYEREGHPINPLTFGVLYDVAHPIVINATSGICNCSRDEVCVQDYEGGPHYCVPRNTAVQRITDLVIAQTGLWTKLLDVDYITQWVTVADVDGSIEGGTAQIGSDNVVTDLIAPDGAVLGTGYVTAEDYQDAWNTIVYDYMATRGGTYYLKAVSRSGNCPQMPPCTDDCTPVGVPPTYCHCDICPPAGAALMMRTTHFSVTGKIPYNVPAASFVMDQNRKAPGAYM